MPKSLRRVTGHGDLHFVTFCCYQRRAFLQSVQMSSLVVQILSEVRARLGFALVGYVVMPEHVHLLIDESGASPSKILQVFKQRVSRRIRARKRGKRGQMALPFGNAEPAFRRFWQRRYYDFNVRSKAKLKEKLQYMHANPVRARLVAHPGDWPWSSWSFYYRGQGLLAMDSWDSERARKEKGGTIQAVDRKERPTLCKNRKG